MKFITAFITAALLLIAPEAYSRNTQLFFSIEEAMQSADFKEKLDPSIPIYFGNQKHSKVKRSITRVSSNKKTNAFNKTDKAACEWALLSALLTFQNRVKTEGGNAVINMYSYYKKNTYKSNTQYECHAGALMAGVALSGEIVTLAK
jgi:hypothetical protein